MEEAKNINCKCHEIFNLWWVKSLVGFLAFLIIFCIGVKFGERHQRNERGFNNFPFQSTRMMNGRGCMMNGGNNGFYSSNQRTQSSAAQSGLNNKPASSQTTNNVKGLNQSAQPGTNANQGNNKTTPTPSPSDNSQTQN